MTNMVESEESEYFTCFLSCWPLYSYLLRQCPFILIDKKPSMALAASQECPLSLPMGFNLPSLPLQTGGKELYLDY